MSNTQNRFIIVSFCILLLSVLFYFFQNVLPRFGNNILDNSLLFFNEYILHYTFTGIHCGKKLLYNSTYPLTLPVLTFNSKKYRIAIVSDLDENSLNEKHTWISYLKTGFLTVDMGTKFASVEWDSNVIELKSTLSQSGRGMELSELVLFNGKVLSFDDRTGIIYEIIGNSVIPWVLLNDGNGQTVKGFKSEWATVKDEMLYVGGYGREWINSTTRTIIHNTYQWIKIINPSGAVSHVNWEDKYWAIRKSLNITFPGYVTHEAVVWSSIHNEWIFLPRRASVNLYNEKDDENNGVNFIIRANEDFTIIRVSTIGPLTPTHDFSSFKFIPGTLDKVIVALKTKEIEGDISSFITVLTLTGDILMPETEVGKYKFEGIEFI